MLNFDRGNRGAVMGWFRKRDAAADSGASGARPQAVEHPESARMDATRAWLDVPYAEKDVAKALGARWDPGARRWYAPPSAVDGLARWAALPDIPELLPGEDRSFGTGL